MHNTHGGKKGDGSSMICRYAVPSVRGMVSATFYSKRFMVSHREICPPRCCRCHVGTKSRKCRKSPISRGRQSAISVAEKSNVTKSSVNVIRCSSRNVNINPFIVDRRYKINGELNHRYFLATGNNPAFLTCSENIDVVSLLN